MGAPVLRHATADSQRATFFAAKNRIEEGSGRVLTPAELAKLQLLIENPGPFDADTNHLYQVAQTDGVRHSTYFCVGVESSLGAGPFSMIAVTSLFCLNPKTFKTVVIMPGDKNVVNGLFIALQGAVAEFKYPANDENLQGRYAGLKGEAGKGLSLTWLGASAGQKEVALAGIGFGFGAAAGLVSIDVFE